MSVEPQVNLNLIEETRKHINRLLDEVSRLSETELSPANYYGEFLKRTLQGLAGQAGAVWVRTPQGHLQLQHQINLKMVGLEKDDASRQSHHELLRQTFQQGRPIHMPPHSSTGPAGEGTVAPGNPTDFDVLLAPIVVEQTVAGLIEIWLNPNRNPNAIPGFLSFLARMGSLASLYLRNSKLRQMVGQEQLWTQLESFARQIHASLNPTEVAYLVANEGRRLIDCDRVSVGVRHAKKCVIEAISGADVVERRSNLVQLMRALADEVLKWGEKLVYTGVKDDSLPPNVLNALDAFLAESNSKLLVVLPLQDEREKEKEKERKAKPPRSVLLMESFEPPASSEQMLARVEVVGKHAASALYNAVEHKRIPLRWLWKPLAKVQEGLGGKARAIALLVVVAVALLIAAMIFVPYPLKMDAKGQLLPVERRWMFSPVPGQVMKFAEGIEPTTEVAEKQPLVLLHDVDLQAKLIQLESERYAAENEIASLRRQMQAATSQADRVKISSELQQKEAIALTKGKQRDELVARTHADLNHPGDFWLEAPIKGTILNSGFIENLTFKNVKPSEPLIRIGDKSQSWEIELRIPQKHIGQVLHAFGSNNPDAELEVDILLSSAPTKVFKGKLARKRIAGEAAPNREDAAEPDPAVVAVVRIEGSDIPAAQRIPRDLLVTGTEVHTKIRCGNRALGYSLFYGLWEFFYEKVVFFF